MYLLVYNRTISAGAYFGGALTNRCTGSGMTSTAKISKPDCVAISTNRSFNHASTGPTQTLLRSRGIQTRWSLMIAARCGLWLAACGIDPFKQRSAALPDGASTRQSGVVSAAKNYELQNSTIRLLTLKLSAFQELVKTSCINQQDMLK